MLRLFMLRRVRTLARTHAHANTHTHTHTHTQVLRPFMLRRVKTDKDLCLSMPENREVVIKCTLSALQKIQYRQLAHATLRSRDEQGNFRATAYNNTVMRLRQVCNHPVEILKSPIYSDHL